jgi:hypothetical protein
MSAIVALSHCNSPIEGKFVQAIFDVLEANGFSHRYDTALDEGKCRVIFTTGGDLPCNPNGIEFVLHVDVSPSWGQGKRFDIFLDSTSAYMTTLDIAVELDGAKFHSSPDQVASDKKKDRTALYNERAVVRFTGSEIYNDAKSLCKELIEYIIENHGIQIRRTTRVWNAAIEHCVANLSELNQHVRQRGTDG